MRTTPRTSPTAVLALVLHALVSVAFPLGEVLHTHAQPHEAQWHAEGDACDDARAHGECALLRVGTAPGLPGLRVGPEAAPAIVVDRAPTTQVGARSIARSGATLPRAPPAA